MMWLRAGGGREGPGSQPGPWPASTRVPPPVARAAAARPQHQRHEAAREGGGRREGLRRGRASDQQVSCQERGEDGVDAFLRNTSLEQPPFIHFHT